ncbi:MAG: response regulator [Polyangiaceae bacterium]|nr:response regulator [Polyangiaceae bacterium]
MTKKAKILVIDDSEVVLAQVKARLLREGYELVTTTQTVGAARLMLGCELVVIDYHMPGMDGAEVLASLRHAARAIGAAPLFYLYTSDPKIAPLYSRHGFDGAFTAKGDHEALVTQVAAALRMARLKALSRRS